MISVESVPDVSLVHELSFLWLEITEKCNLSCSHCYADSGPQGKLYGNMAYEDWTRVIDEAAELGCRSVQFIGGEPTMHPQLEDLVDYANHRGFTFIEVFTNATRLGTELLGCFQRNRVHVATSFYSDDPLIHQEITRDQKSWQRTVSGIKTVLATGLPIRVGVIETDRNLGHAPRAIEFLKGLGVHNVGKDRERGVGRGKLVSLGGDGERYEELCGQCWKGRLCVTSSGEVFPCVFSRATRLGDVKSGLRGILQSTKLTHFRQKVRAMDDARSSGICSPDESIMPCWPSKPPCYPDQPCSPKNPCWPDNPPCWPDKPPDPPPCTPIDTCMPKS